MQSIRNDVNDCHNGCGELWFFLVPRLGKMSGMIRGLEHFMYFGQSKKAFRYCI